MQTLFKCWLLALLAMAVCAPADASPSYLHLSDVHLDLTGQSSDTNPALWKQAQVKLRQLIDSANAPSFVLYTGDLPAHAGCVCPQCQPDADDGKQHHANIAQMLVDLNALVDSASIPLLFMPGNNDSLAGDYYSFTDASGQTPLALDPGAKFPAVNANQACGNAPCMLSAPHPSFGYYSVRPVSGLRVLALNSVIFGVDYCAADGVDQLSAGNQQMAWIAEQLDEAKGVDKVLIAMHIPPGNDAYAVSHRRARSSLWSQHPQGHGDQPRDHMTHWLDQFLDIIAAHEDTVIGLAFGHTHMDELRRLRDRQNAINEVAISAPGITTNHGNNPGFKLIAYHPKSFELLDYTTFYTSDQSEWGNQSYRFGDGYACGELSILDCLRQPVYADDDAVGAVMTRYYTVMGGRPAYSITSGIDITYGQ